MKNLNFFPWLAAFLALGAATAFGGSSTLIAYYPAPSGNYAKLRLVPQGQPAIPCNTGSMYVDNSNPNIPVLMYCDNSNGNGTGAWAGINIIAKTPLATDPANYVATKGYVDSKGSGGCYVSHNVTAGTCSGPNACYPGFTNEGCADGSNGSGIGWGMCSNIDATNHSFYTVREPGANCDAPCNSRNPSGPGPCSCYPAGYIPPGYSTGSVNCSMNPAVFTQGEAVVCCQ